MSSSHYANTAWIVTEDKLKKIAPSAWEKFLNVLDEISVAEFCQAVNIDGDIDVSDVGKKEIAKAWKEFADTFTAGTCVEGAGLEITPRYHDQSNDGDCADDIDGAFFEIDGMEELTPAGLEYASLFQKAYWVTYG